jgi:hypothetical protein
MMGVRFTARSRIRASSAVASRPCTFGGVGTATAWKGRFNPRRRHRSVTGPSLEPREAGSADRTPAKRSCSRSWPARSPARRAAGWPPGSGPSGRCAGPRAAGG